MSDGLVFKYVTLPWERYHSLDRNAKATIWSTSHDAIARAMDECGDSGGCSANQVILLPAADAVRLKNAFDDLCWASWTPNQSSEDQRENGKIIKAAQAVIEELT